MMSRPSSLLIVSGIASVLACGESESHTRDSQPLSVTDSAGASVIEHDIAAAPLHFQPLSLNDAVRLTFDTVRIENDIEGALGRSEIVILEEGQPSVLVLPIGEQSSAIRLGRQGAGPGEFARVDAIWRWGASLAAFDSRQRRVHLVMSDSTEYWLSDPISLQPIHQASLQPVRFDGVLTPSRFLISLVRAQQPAHGLNLPEMTVAAASLGETSFIDTLFSALDSEFYVEMREGGAFRVRTPPLTRERHVLVAGQSVVFADEDSGTIEWYGLQGDLLRRLRRVNNPQTAEPANLGRIFDHIYGSRTQQQRSITEERDRAVMVHESVADFCGAMAAGEHVLFVLECAWHGEFDGEVSVYDFRSNEVRGLRIPPAGRLLDVSGGRVLLAWGGGQVDSLVIARFMN